MKGEKVCIFVLVCGVVETVLFREGEVGVNQERERESGRGLQQTEFAVGYFVWERY